MQFEAKIRNPGFIFNNWRERRQSCGLVSGIKFVWNGKDYVAEESPLSPESLAVLIPNAMIAVSVITPPTGTVVPLPKVESVPPTKLRDEFEPFDPVPIPIPEKAKKVGPTITKLTSGPKK